MKFGSSRKDKRLKEISAHGDLMSADNDLTSRSKINFSYLDANQVAGHKIRELDANKLHDLLEKIKEHGKKSLEELARTPIGGGSKKSSRGNLLKIYKTFPPSNKTEFKEPTYTPEGVHWGTLRITGAIRLAGFVIPPEYHGQIHPATNEFFDKNTFYVVFLDIDHKFWLCE